MNSTCNRIVELCLDGGEVSHQEAMIMYREAPLAGLMAAAHTMRQRLHPGNSVTWITDRNVNISNVCHAGCLFCNFSCSRSSDRAYITTIEEYREKIDELFALGGRQLLLQGGLHPDLGLAYYSDLFRSLKSEYPMLKLHALGPPEIVHIAQLEGADYGTVLDELISAGLDSLPGAGAEILSDRVREQLSPGKCTTEEWLEVMHEAHKRNITTSATMMFGHIETLEERISHLLLLRGVQNLKPAGAKGFISFIPWPFQDTDTVLAKRHNVYNKVTSMEYIRLIAVSRLILNNFDNIQPSWLTVGLPAAQICLHGGANDFGSIMIEEHVVSSAGATHKIDAEGIKEAIRLAGFEPVQRDQEFGVFDSEADAI